MKRLLFILATISLLFACGGSKNKQETPPAEEATTTVKETVKEKADDVADFTAEQWAELKKEYNDLVEKAKKEAEKSELSCPSGGTSTNVETSCMK